MRLNEAALSAGSAADALRTIGGFSRNPRDWRLILSAIVVARPAVDGPVSGQAGLASAETHAAVFNDQILRIEQVALSHTPRARSENPTASGSPAILRMQVALNARGFLVGTPDGVAGPRTTTAIMALQQAEGHTPTGVLTEQQLQRLLEATR
jgi:hypothetical protein